MNIISPQEPYYVGPQVGNVHQHPLQPASFDGMQETYPHPIERFYNDTAAPWSSQRGYGVRSTPTPYFVTARPGSHAPRPVANFSIYRSGPLSVGSNDTGPRASDSGYATQTAATETIASADPISYGQECHSLISQIEDVQLEPETHGACQPDVCEERNQQQYNKPSQRKKVPQPCPQCSAILNCRSEFKYVILFACFARY